MSSRTAPSDAEPKQGRVLLRFVFGFVCVFGGLSLPSPGLGPLYLRAHAALGNAVLEGHTFASGIGIHLEAREETLLVKPWEALLVVARAGHAPLERVGVDLRTLGYLPTAAFVALVAATPGRSVRRNVGILLLGLAILVPLLLLLIALPLVSFLGGQGPVKVFALSPFGHVIVNIVYRALVAPPGMAYAVPLLLYWALLQIPVEAFGVAALITKFQRKSPRDVTSAPSHSS